MARRFAWVFLAGGVSTVWASVFATAGTPPIPQTTAADSQDELAIAATCLDRGEETAAAAHLFRHLEAHPDRPLVRFSLAELLWRRGRLAEARTEYERFVRETQLRASETTRLVHAHTRLMALAEQGGDSYGEHLHRGVGLYLLAGCDAAATESLLCKAAGELMLASRERPMAAQPHLYLHFVWARLGQSQPAERHLLQATSLAIAADLTPVEQREMAMAASHWIRRP